MNRRLLIIAVLLSAITCANVLFQKGECQNASHAFNLYLQFQIYSIDLKTEILYSADYSFRMWTTANNVTSFDVVILRPDHDEGLRLPSYNESGAQQVCERIQTDPSKVSVPWQWHLNPKHPLGLGFPFDCYELSFLIALNLSTKLELNDTWFIMPVSLRGDWTWEEHAKVNKLTGPPNNQALLSHGLSPEKFYQYRCNEMTDFYLIVQTFSFPPVYSWRITIAYFLPSIAILGVLGISAKNFRRMQRSDFLRLYLGVGLFTLTFLVSFYQFAPWRVFTWQEVIFYIDFLFATALVVAAIVLKGEQSPRGKNKEENLQRETTQAEHKEVSEQQIETSRSIDKAFEWFVLLLTILVGILFQFLTWITQPQAQLQFIGMYMLSLVAPLVVSVLAWLAQLITLHIGRKIFLRLFSWSISSIVFFYYIQLFVTLVAFSSIKDYLTVAVITLMTGAVFAILFPYRQIVDRYRSATINDGFWNKPKWYISIPYLGGAIIAAFLVLIPLSIL